MFYFDNIDIIQNTRIYIYLDGMYEFTLFIIPKCSTTKCILLDIITISTLLPIYGGHILGHAEIYQHIY